jgi:hypothetical protein
LARKFAFRSWNSIDVAETEHRGTGFPSVPLRCFKSLNDHTTDHSRRSYTTSSTLAAHCFQRQVREVRQRSEMAVVRWRQNAVLTTRAQHSSGKWPRYLLLKKLSGETEDEFGQDLDFHRLSVFDLSGFEDGAELLQGQGQRQYDWMLR